MRGIVSLLLVAALLACNGAGNPERGALESTDSAVVNASGADVFPPPTGSQAGLAVGFDGTNHLVVWSDARGGTGQDLYGARVSKAGVVLGSAPIVISAASGDEVAAAVAFDGTNYLVVWQDSRGSTGRDIYGARVSPDGTVLDPGGSRSARRSSTRSSPRWRSTGRAISSSGRIGGAASPTCAALA